MGKVDRRRRPVQPRQPLSPTAPPIDTALADAELAYGLPLGCDHGLPPPDLGSFDDPRVALRARLRKALLRPPCFIGFSGGRDSSALLATAVDVARHEGLPLPIPATLVFPGDASSDEEQWQRIVLDHLDLRQWHRIVIEGDELDAIGPAARSLMTRHGLLWPFNTHFHVPIAAAAGGGTVVTGFGGDELAISSRSRQAARILKAGRPLSVSSLLIVGFAMSPDFIRRAVISRRFDKQFAALEWLSQAGFRQLRFLSAADEAAESWRWDEILTNQFINARYFRLSHAAFDALGSDYDVQFEHPFVHSWVLGALARRYGAAGPANRSALVAELFADVLPDAIVNRTSKGAYSNPLWTSTARSFANEWEGDSPSSLVDHRKLQAMWRQERLPDIRTTMLLQAAWLSNSITHDVTPREERPSTDPADSSRAGGALPPSAS